MKTLNKFTPNFSHRLSALSNVNDSFTINDLEDSVYLMLDQAIAQLQLIGLQFNEDAVRISDDSNLAALFAVENCLKDIRAVLKTFAEQQKTGS